MNTVEFVRCTKNDVQVCLMFDKIVFDPSLGYANPKHINKLTTNFKIKVKACHKYCKVSKILNAPISLKIL